MSSDTPTEKEAIAVGLAIIEGYRQPEGELSDFDKGMTLLQQLVKQRRQALKDAKT